jgi:transposase
MTVIIGMDPHQRSATIEIIDEHGHILAKGKYGTDKAGYTDMLKAGRTHGERVRAIEGCNGIGKHLAHRLLQDQETVLDVPATLSAQVRVFATGNGRKTDPLDAHSLAMVALRSPHLCQIHLDADLIVMGLLVDRRDEPGRARTQTINRLHRLLLELFPGGATQFLSATQARALTATIKPHDLVGKTRRRPAVELTSELEAIDKKTKTADKDLRELVTARGCTLQDLHGIGRPAPHGCSPTSATSTASPTGTVRVLEWHRTPGRLLRRPTTPPTLPRRQPQNQPDAAHHGRRPVTQSHRWARLF